jgi:hypothetical protein
MSLLLLALIVWAMIASELASMPRSKQISIGGLTMVENSTVTANCTVALNPPLQPPPEALVNGTPTPIPLAQAGTLTVQSSSTAGTAVMSNPSHGLVEYMRVDVYWVDANAINRVLYGATVGPVSGTAVPFSGGTASGSGTALPVVDTAVVIAVSNVYPYLLNGTNAVAMAANCSSECVISLQSSGSDILTLHLVAGQVWDWFQGTPNPLGTNSLTEAFISVNNQAVQQNVDFAALSN